MDNKTANFNESEFLEKLKNLYDLEIQKPLKEINTEFIDEIVSLSLEIQGLKAELTPEEVEEKVRKIPFVEIATLNTTPESVKGRATKVKSHKILLIAAIISILVAIFTITSIAFDWNIFDELKNRFGTVAETPVNEMVDVNGVTVVMRGENKDYDCLEAALVDIDLNILYPTKLPQNILLNKIVLSNFDAKEKLVFSFNDKNFTYSILLKNEIPKDALYEYTEKVNINDIECYIFDMQDLGIVQIYFKYNDDLYKLTYNNKQDLIKVIENLKELK